MAVLMKFMGGEIKGNVNSGELKDCIELSGISFGFSRPVYTSGGLTAERRKAQAAASEITCTRSLHDALGLELWKASVGTLDKKDPKVEIYCTTGTSEKVVPYLIIKLAGVKVSNYVYSMQEGSSDASFDLIWDTLDIEYKATPDPKAKGAVTPARVHFDRPTATT
jgi:type VI protein secretion system component Hcp